MSREALRWPDEPTWRLQRGGGETVRGGEASKRFRENCPGRGSFRLKTPWTLYQTICPQVEIVRADAWPARPRKDQQRLPQGNQGFVHDDWNLGLEQFGLPSWPTHSPLFGNWKFQVFVLAWLRCTFNSIYIVIDVEWMNLYLFLINVLGLAIAFLWTNLEGKYTEQSGNKNHLRLDLAPWCSKCTDGLDISGWGEVPRYRAP